MIMSHYEHYRIVIGEKGRIVVPARLRRRLGIHSGDHVSFTVDSRGRVLFRTAEHQVEDLRRGLERRARAAAKRRARAGKRRAS